MAELNQFLPNLKFTNETSREKVAFLDVGVGVKNGMIFTDLHTKSTDCHQYLHCISSHPKHIKISSIYIQAPRVSHIYF